MRDFDGAMQSLDEKFNFMIQGPGYVSRKNEGDKLIAFERGGLLWVLNFHPTKVGVSSGRLCQSSCCTGGTGPSDNLAP